MSTLKPHAVALGVHFGRLPDSWPPLEPQPGVRSIASAVTLAETGARGPDSSGPGRIDTADANLSGRDVNYRRPPSPALRISDHRPEVSDLPTLLEAVGIRSPYRDEGGATHLTSSCCFRECSSSCLSQPPLGRHPPCYDGTNSLWSVLRIAPNVPRNDTL
jgi:hypothetical protein